MYKLSNTLVLGLLVALAASVPSAAQDGCTFLGEGQQPITVCCLGADCGVGMADPFTEEAFQCHSISVEGVQCWAAPGAFDGLSACEFIPGFGLQPLDQGELMFEPAVACDQAFGSAGGGAGQLLVGVGGYDLFRNQIRRRARPRIVREHAQAAAIEAGQEEPEEDGATLFTEMTTSAELEDWQFKGIAGATPGARFSWRRQGETGQLFGLSASYQEADPDVGETSRLFNGSVSYGHTLGPVWTLSLAGTVSEFSGYLDDTLIGASGVVGFSKYSDRGTVASGGLVVQYLASDHQRNDLQTAGFGLAFGFPLGRRLALDLEGYGVSILEGEMDEDGFYTAAGLLSIYATPKFAVTLGYRLLEGIEEYQSDTFTFGASTRWQ